MNGQGHFVRMKKPSKPELYEDASRILEEFLRKQVNDARSAHGHPSRFKTHPMSSFRPLTSAEVIDERAEPSLPENIDRSYTMPTRARDESGTAGVRLKVNKLDMLMERVTQKPAADTDNGALSADTEGDSEHNLLHRKKKGFLQKAVDRLLYVMHRQERERECSVTVDKKGSLRNGHKKHHVNSITTELQKPTIDMHAKTDKSGSSVDTRKESYASQFGLRGRRSSSVGKAFFSSLRKSFRPRKGSNKHDNVSGTQSFICSVVATFSEILVLQFEKFTSICLIYHHLRDIVGCCRLLCCMFYHNVSFVIVNCYVMPVYYMMYGIV